MLLNPKNAPDAWEVKALAEMDTMKSKSVSTKVYIDGEEYYRYIEPFVTKDECMKCHGVTGYEVGKVNGAVSVLIPMDKYTQRAYEYSTLSFLLMLIIYLLGVWSVLYGRLRARKVIKSKIQNYEQHLYSLVNIIEKRDEYTAGHSQRVANYSVLIAKRMDFSNDDLDTLYRACILHDIGKVSTPDSILLNPGKLNHLEYDIIKEHVVVSYELLSKVDIYKDIAEIIRHHHEHYDGSGYPQGIKGDEIPLMAQIMTVADSFDAMTTNRVYKAKKSVSIAIEELIALGDKQFDMKIVQIASNVLKDIEIDTEITQLPKSKIEKERFSYFYRDQVTGVYNKKYLEFALAYNHTDEFNVCCIHSLSLHDFNQYNKKYSWEEGDKLLKQFAQKLNSLSKSDFIFRIYGDNFIILNKEYYHFEDDFESLKPVLDGTGVSFTYKQLDMLSNKIYHIKDLEMLL